MREAIEPNHIEQLVVAAADCIRPVANVRYAMLLEELADGVSKTRLECRHPTCEHAQAEGVVLLLEPLNRYEDHLLNRLEQALDVVESAKSDSVRLLADAFHMNIEEPDLAAAIRHAGTHIHHVQLADSNRQEPGARTC